MGFFTRDKPAPQPYWGFGTKNKPALKRELLVGGTGTTGKVEKNTKRFPEELGEEHPFDFAKPEGVYKRMSFVSGAVDNLIDFVWGPGFTVKSKAQRAVDILEQWNKDTSFKVIGKRWLREALVKGTGFLELGGEKKTKDRLPTVEGIKVLNANHMYIKTDDEGNVERFNQYIKDPLRFSKNDATPFDPYQVAVFAFKQIGDCPYGYGLVYPNMKKIDEWLMASKSLHVLMQRKANTPLIAYMGDRQSGIVPPGEAVKSFGDDMTVMTERSEWAVDDYIRFATVDFGNIGEKFEVVLKNDEDHLFFGFQTPEVIMGRGSIPEGLAKVQLEKMDRLADSIREELEHIIVGQIYQRILEANSIAAEDLEIKWGRPSASEIAERIKEITELLKLPMLGDNMRVALEEELAKLMDVDVEVEPAEEREEEEEEPQPRVPGSNQQAYPEGELLED